jgi:hypothetical protein
MSAPRDIPYANEHWYLVLADAIKASSVQAVADRLGYGRARISQVKNGLMLNVDPKPVADKVLALLDRWHCPYLNTDIVGHECREVHTGPTPSHDPAKLAQRRICRTCKHNTKGDQS